MNRYIEHYKSKYKPLIERLSQPRTLTFKNRHILAFGLALGILGIGTYNTGYRLGADDAKPRREVINSENMTYFEYFRKNLVMGSTYVTNQKGEEVEVKELLEESVNGPEAIRFAQAIVEDAYIFNPKKTYESLESKIDLAKSVIKQTRKELQLTSVGGKGNYTQKYEVGEDKDSRQTFDEFYGPKDGKEFAGDCDDFAMALTTAYHAIRDYAEDNKLRGPFFKALAEGLGSYRIFGISLLKHAVNIGVTLKNGKIAGAEAIEPQDMNSKIKLKVRKNRILIDYFNEKGEKITDRIWRLYGRDISAYPKYEF